MFDLQYVGCCFYTEVSKIINNDHTLEKRVKYESMFKVIRSDKIN